jgi:hypothetical protein
MKPFFSSRLKSIKIKFLFYENVAFELLFSPQASFSWLYSVGFLKEPFLATFGA